MNPECMTMGTGFDKDILKESKKSADLLNKSARNAIDGKIRIR